MSRPRRDAARPPARERVEAAFWELLSERPYREITIAALARRAQVNHNTFYYHFTSLADLAGQQVDRTLTPRVPQALVSALSSGAVDLRQLDADPEFLANFRRICLLVGPHSTPWIIDQVRDSALQVWYSWIGREPDDLNTSERAQLAFILGGMLAILGDQTTNGAPATLESLVHTELGKAVATTFTRLRRSG